MTFEELKQRTMRSPDKIDLPKRTEYLGTFSWLKAIKEFVGQEIIFALDEAFMCRDHYLGSGDEYLVWVYGDESLCKYNGIVVLDNNIDSNDVEERCGLLFTNFYRTLNDAFANEDTLYMEGTTVALSHYYFTHNESFEGLSVAPEHHEKFEKYKIYAMEYYDS